MSIKDIKSIKKVFIFIKNKETFEFAAKNKVELNACSMHL